jgi:hypothetical protein
MMVVIVYLLLRPVGIYLGVAERDLVDLKGLEPLRRGLEGLPHPIRPETNV